MHDPCIHLLVFTNFHVPTTFPSYKNNCAQQIYFLVPCFESCHISIYAWEQKYHKLSHQLGTNIFDNVSVITFFKVWMKCTQRLWTKSGGRLLLETRLFVRLKDWASGVDCYELNYRNVEMKSRGLLTISIELLNFFSNLKIWKFNQTVN